VPAVARCNKTPLHAPSISGIDAARMQASFARRRPVAQDRISINPRPGLSTRWLLPLPVDSRVLVRPDCIINTIHANGDDGVAFLVLGPSAPRTRPHASVTCDWSTLQVDAQRRMRATPSTLVQGMRVWPSGTHKSAQVDGGLGCLLTRSCGSERVLSQRSCGQCHAPD
jgi:hypothetical protein